MPSAPPRHCPRCRSAHHGRCPRSKREPFDGGRGSTRRWREIRSAILARDPVCVRCRAAAATDVHHVVPVSRGGSADEANLVGMCHACHTAIPTRQGGGESWAAYGGHRGAHVCMRQSPRLFFESARPPCGPPDDAVRPR